MMNPHTLSAVLAVCSLGYSGLALAQSPPATTAPQPVSAPATPPGAHPAGGAAVEANAEERARVRWGISGLAGPLLGGLSGGVGGVDVRIGAQLTNMFGIYGRPALLVGAGSDASISGASSSALALFGAGALADFTFSDLFFVGVGPEIAYAALASSSAPAGAVVVKTTAAAGAYFSAAARAGFAFGSMKPQRRRAFTVALDFRTVFTPGDPVVMPLLALGYDAF